MDEHQEKYAELVEAVASLAQWMQDDRGSDVFWCGEEFATGVRGSDGPEYVECSPVQQCGTCIRLNAVQYALAAVRESQVSEGGV